MELLPRRTAPNLLSAENEDRCAADALRVMKRKTSCILIRPRKVRPQREHERLQSSLMPHKEPLHPEGMFPDIRESPPP